MQRLLWKPQNVRELQEYNEAKMDFSKILTDYPYKTELHAHSFPVSSCGDFPADEVVKIYAEAGVDSLVLTNHLSPHNCDEGVEHYLSDYYKAQKAAE